MPEAAEQPASFCIRLQEVELLQSFRRLSEQEQVSLVGELCKYTSRVAANARRAGGPVTDHRDGRVTDHRDGPVTDHRGGRRGRGSA